MAHEVATQKRLFGDTKHLDPIILPAQVKSYAFEKQFGSQNHQGKETPLHSERDFNDLSKTGIFHQMYVSSNFYLPPSLLHQVYFSPLSILKKKHKYLLHLISSKSFANSEPFGKLFMACFSKSQSSAEKLKPRMNVSLAAIEVRGREGEGVRQHSCSLNVKYTLQPKLPSTHHEWS